MLNGFPLIIAITAALIFIIVACSVLRWHPFLVLLGTALALGLVCGLPADKTITTVVQGGGSVFGSIGMIIALGTILGAILESTGAATAIAAGIIRRTGPQKTLGGMSILGAVTGIPVFCDSGFVILSNLGKSLSRQTATSYGAISIALATGLYTSHVLIPPTPGPLAAAGNLGITHELGWVIVLGIITAIPALLTGYFFARKMARHTIPADIPEEQVHTVTTLPTFGVAVIPLLLPVVLIAAGSLLHFISLPDALRSGLLFICNPNIALLLSMIVAFILLARPYRKEWNQWIQKALSQAGPIILITTAGGALGAVLKATPLADGFQQLVEGKSLSSFILFPVAYALAAGLKTSQGSSTAALVIASSIIAPLMDGLALDHPAEKALLVLCIGAGSMTVSHANDSYFWVISQYSGISVPRMYRYFTVSTFWMGLVVLLSCMGLAMLF